MIVGNLMHRQTVEIPGTKETPNATILSLPDFEEFEGHGFVVIWGKISAGVNVTALLDGANTDFCQRSHWGFILDGAIHVRYSDGTEEVPKAGAVVHWPAGHAIYTEDENAEFVLFSPTEAQSDMQEQLKQKESELSAALPIWE